ncbi:MAG: class I SAM-dependent methyltransferase [Candidatus Thiodiazotropha sp.]
MPYNLDIPGQVSEFELRAIEVVASLLPKNAHIVEVGSLFGRSSWAWAKSSAPSVTVHCIDPWRDNKGVRAMEAQYGVKYGIDAFKQFTSDCVNIETHPGYSPRDFKEWATPIDLYFEDAVHVDPVLSQNIEFWSSKLKPAGILCGDDYRPRFPDVRAAAERMAKRFGRRLHVVDFFWCLLPDEAELPGAGRGARELDELLRECTRKQMEKGASISMKLVAPIRELTGKGPHKVEVLVTNDGAKAWPPEQASSPSLIALVQPADPQAKPRIVATQPVGAGQLQPDIPNHVELLLDMEEVTVGTFDLNLNLRAESGGKVHEWKGSRLSGLQLITEPDPAAIGDFVVRPMSAQEGVPSSGLRLDDVVHAHRWILGRDPENSAKLQAHINRAAGKSKRLRRNLLKSAGFGRRFAARFGDFVDRLTSAPVAQPISELRLDDVVHAYRWILGREPEDPAKLQVHIDSVAGNSKRLRLNLLSSAEFRHRQAALGLRNSSSEADAVEVPPFAPEAVSTRPLVFIHLPKTGGTTVHYHLQTGYPASQVCSLRHNNVLTAPACKLVRCSLFSGHFDARILHLVARPLLVTVFRDPGERLYSLYRHLRFTTPDRQVAENHTLAELARSAGFEDFLREASHLNPGTVDNAYVRALGGTLPIARWEMSAEPEWVKRHGQPSDTEWAEMVARATAVLTLSDTTILSFPRLAQDLGAYLRKVGLAASEPIRHLKNSNAITEETLCFKPVEIETYAPNQTLERLTRYDRQLFSAMEVLT